MKRARVSPPPVGVPSLPGVNPALEGTIAHLINSRAVGAESPQVPNVADIVAEMVSEDLSRPEMTISDDRKEGLSQWPPKFGLPALHRSLRCSHSDARQ